MLKIILIIFLLSSTAVSVPRRYERARIATVQAVVERISRVLQAFRRTLQTNPSQQQLGRMSVRLRQLSTNLRKVRDYLDPQQFNQARDALNALQHSIDNSGTGNNSGFNTTSTTVPLMSRPLVNRPSLLPGRTLLDFGMALSTAVLIAVTIKSAYLSKSLVDRCPEKSAEPSASSSVDSNTSRSVWSDLYLMGLVDVFLCGVVSIEISMGR